VRLQEGFPDTELILGAKGFCAHWLGALHNWVAFWGPGTESS
jgi:hypothetical protein